MIEIEDEFEDYMRKTNPRLPAHSTQYRESRRVFFAGAASMFAFLCSLTQLPDEEGIRRLETMRGQLKEFAKRVGEERD